MSGPVRAVVDSAAGVGSAPGTAHASGRLPVVSVVAAGSPTAAKDAPRC